MMLLFLLEHNGINSLRLFFLCCISLRITNVQCEKHLLQFVYTALIKPAGSSGAEFSAVSLYDDRRISHYSKEEKAWKRDGLNAEICRGFEEPDKDWFIHLLYSLANCTRSECDGLHTLQRRVGCEVDAVMNVKAFDEYRYDGEDFIAFNVSTTQWMEKNPRAKETKMEWNNYRSHNLYLQSNLNTCMSWISTCNDSVQNTPDVHMFARCSHAPHERHMNLTCLATGFYPKHIKMKITSNGTELKPFSSTGVRPNDNQTFQMRISVEIHRDKKKSYECHVSHSSQKQTLISKWDNKHTHCSEESRRHGLAAAASAVLVLLCLWFICTGITQKELNSQMNSNGSSRREGIISGSPELLKPVERNRFQWLLGLNHFCTCSKVKPEELLPTFMRFFQENTSQGFKFTISFHRSDPGK